MIRLRKLLVEGVAEKRFADIFVYAFTSIMDVDAENIRVEGITYRKNPTAFMHCGYNLKVVLRYRNNKVYYIPVTFFYYKFPPDELGSVNRKDWDTMLKNSEAFPEQDLDEKFLLKPNKLFAFKGGVVEGENFFDGKRLGDFDTNSILEAVKQAKAIIDKSDSGENDVEKETPPMPVSSKDLVSTYQ